jgi:hypothetical protein
MKENGNEVRYESKYAMNEGMIVVALMIGIG